MRLFSWSCVNWEKSEDDIIGRPLFEMSGVTSGCEKRRVHEGTPSRDSFWKTAWASEMVETGVALI